MRSSTAPTRSTSCCRTGRGSPATRPTPADARARTGAYDLGRASSADQLAPAPGLVEGASSRPASCPTGRRSTGRPTSPSPTAPTSSRPRRARRRSRRRPRRPRPSSRRSTCAGIPVGLKASGGIRTLADARAYLELAERIMGDGGSRRTRSASAPAACSTPSSPPPARPDGRASQPLCPAATPSDPVHSDAVERRTGDSSIDWGALDAVLFDLDGVLTPTAEIHERAWKTMFDAFLAARADGGEWDAVQRRRLPAYVDGKPRFDGVRSFLESRDIDLPEGTHDDAPGHGTVNALGNTKNATFQQVLRRDGIEPYPGSVRLLDALDERGTAMAVVSSSRNATEVLAAAGPRRRFEVVVDGTSPPPGPAGQAGAGHVPRRRRRARRAGRPGRRRRGRHLGRRRRPRRRLRPRRRRRSRRRARRPPRARRRHRRRRPRRTARADEGRRR